MSSYSRRDFLRSSAYAAGLATVSTILPAGMAQAIAAPLSSTSSTAWLQNNLSVLGSRPLRHICMPGTHDAGMSAYNSGTAFTHSCDTVTQTTGILGQLQYGSRYFDIRPVISGGQFMTGHYTDVTQLNSWQGANGQSIQSIIDDVNNYTASNSELVVLYLSHDLNTDLGNSSYAPLTQQEWNTLLTLLQEGINNLFVTSASDLTTLTLNTFIGNNKAAVVVVVDPSGTGISLGNYANGRPTGEDAGAKDEFGRLLFPAVMDPDAGWHASDLLFCFSVAGSEYSESGQYSQRRTQQQSLAGLQR